MTVAPETLLRSLLSMAVLLTWRMSCTDTAYQDVNGRRAAGCGPARAVCTRRFNAWLMTA
jgi:hypothetical protein